MSPLHKSTDTYVSLNELSLIPCDDDSDTLWDIDMSYFESAILDQHSGQATVEHPSQPSGLIDRDDAAATSSTTPQPSGLSDRCVTSSSSGVNTVQPASSSVNMPPAPRGIAASTSPQPSTSSVCKSPAPKRKYPRGVAAPTSPQPSTSSVCESPAPKRKYPGGKPQPMLPPTSPKSDSKKKKGKQETSPNPPSKKFKKAGVAGGNFEFTISSRSLGEPKSTTIYTSNSIIDFKCDIRKHTAKGTIKSPTLKLEHTSYSQISTHLTDSIRSLFSELSTRNTVSTGNMTFPQCGVGVMTKYIISFTPIYDPNAPGINSHIEYICAKIVDTILGDIKLINV